MGLLISWADLSFCSF
jgi:hypothetical protein